ncbi:FlgO family outer membrane protein [Azonexus sp.]|uniref:FlgO family outer membrane protein n=1 Tax=Azonexus sp. TaxID=1872668 RepID=UPI0027BADBB9|nr:FlgO family outer membrane protein [Azonexus sp.]
MMTRVLPICLASAFVLSGCETLTRSPQSTEPTYEQAAQHSFKLTNYAALDALMKGYQGSSAVAGNHIAGGSGAPFLVATLANIDQLEQSSTLGRTISEQIASRMTQTGHSVIELKVRNGVYMKRNEGEFLLTREIREVATSHKAQAVVIGTYAESASFIHVNLKLVDPSTSIIIAAHDYTLPLDRQNRSMLTRGR